MTELEDALAYGDKYLSSFQHKQIDLRQVEKKIIICCPIIKYDYSLILAKNHIKSFICCNIKEGESFYDLIIIHFMNFIHNGT